MAWEAVDPVASPGRPRLRGHWHRHVTPAIEMTTNANEPPDPKAADIIRRVRRLMMISAATTIFAVALVVVLVGFRVWRGADNAPPPDVSAAIPSGARILSTAVAEDRILVTIEYGGAVEIRSFDARSLKPAGRLRLSPGQ